MTQSHSMTRGLLLTILTIVLVAWAAASALGLLVMQDEFSEVFDASVETTALRILPLAEHSGSPNATWQQQNQTSTHDYLVYRILDAKGETIFRSSVDDSPFSDPSQLGFWDGEAYRVYTAVSADGTHVVQVADAFENRREAILEASGALLLPLLLLVPATFFAIVFAVRRHLRPIAVLRQEIASRDGGNLSAIAGQELPVELEPIANSVNALLAKVKSTIEAERDFASNSAHELRTPVAGALAQVQRLQAEIPNDYHPRLKKVEHSLSSLTKIVEKLLQLHRSGAELVLSTQRMDVASLVRFVVQDVERLAQTDRDIVLSFDSGFALERRINVDAAGIVLRNLLENALSHSTTGSVVTVSFDTAGAILIENDCEPVDSLLMPKLTQRFTRGRTNAVGSGLGLAIATRLAEQMGAKLQLNSPIPGSARGFQARLVF